MAHEPCIDPYDGRQPTSHERAAGQPWDASYHGAGAPWDIGAPQPAVARLLDAGAFRGTVLDAGCGTGENALLLAAAGIEVLGVDVAQTAVAMARDAARTRGLAAAFEVADALALDRLGRTFDTVLDCALFHAFDPEERRRYVRGLASVTRPGATLHLLCFGDGDGDGEAACLGPHPVDRRALSAPFTGDSGWRIAEIGPERLLARFAADGAAAWVARVERIG